jgi:hypothetical protein
MAEILLVLDALLAATPPALERDGFDAPPARPGAFPPPAWAVEPVIEDAISLDSALDAPVWRAARVPSPAGGGTPDGAPEGAMDRRAVAR